MSTFGTALRVSTFGESHGCSVGCMIDGLPGGLRVCTKCVQLQLRRRRPGAAAAASSSSRNESDTAEIVSGVERGLTLGSPISIIIKNQDTRKQDYSNIGISAEKNNGKGGIQGILGGIPRPGHAELTYLVKYGNMSSSGGGRSSARETAARVAAAALIESSLLVPFYNCRALAFVSSVGAHSIPEEALNKYICQPPARREIDRNGTVLFDFKCNQFRDATGQTHPGISETELSVLLGHHEKAVNENLFQNNLGRDFQRQVPHCEKEIPEEDQTWEVHTRCPHIPTAVKIARTLLQVRADGDSIGGSVCCIIENPPAGIGEPVFDRLPAKLAHAMLSIPATKGFEIGSGFNATCMRGSEHNDPIYPKERTNLPSPHSINTTRRYCDCEQDGATEKHANMQQTEIERDTGIHEEALRACAEAATNLKCKTNRAGGTLGGISTGENINIRVAFKPPSSISKAQLTSDFSGNLQQLQIKGRHDPCVVARAVPVVEAMAVLAIGDLLMQQASRVGFSLLRGYSDEIKDEDHKISDLG